MPCLDAPQDSYIEAVEAPGWWAARFSQGDLRRVIAAEHTGLLGREEREALEQRFKAHRTATLVRKPAVGHTDAGDGRGHRRPVVGAAVCRPTQPGQLLCSASAGPAAAMATP